MIVEQFVEQALRDRASDIHLVQGLTPRYRVNGEIREMCSNCLTAEDCLTAAMELAGGDFRRAETVGEADPPQSFPPTVRDWCSFPAKPAPANPPPWRRC